MTHRRVVVATVLLAVAAAWVITTESAGGARASARHCSASGDVCFGAFGGGTATHLRMTLAAHLLTRYTLCVRAPGGRRDCRRFRVVAAARGTFASSVRWASHFPYRGRGHYRATWSFGSGPAATIAFPVGPSIHVAPGSVRAGDAVRVSGLAGGCPSGSRVTLISRAFSRARDFAGIPAVVATVRRDDTYRVRTRVPAARRPGVRTVTARCGGGNFGVTAHLRVR